MHDHESGQIGDGMETDRWIDTFANYLVLINLWFKESLEVKSNKTSQLYNWKAFEEKQFAKEGPCCGRSLPRNLKDFFVFGGFCSGRLRKKLNQRMRGRSSVCGRGWETQSCG